jgi:hypothetical protein
MAVTSGFFNSVSGDRKYDAEDVNSFFDGVLAEGVISTIGDIFAVEDSSGMQISVGSGKAWFLKSWIANSTNHFLVLSSSDITYDRIDVIALDMDKSDGVRDNDIIIVEGTPASSPAVPAMINTATHLQIPLANILVRANVTVINQADITNRVGTVDCPFATGIVDQVDIDILLQQWEAEFDAWLVGFEEDLAAIDTGTVFLELNDMRDRGINYKNLLINGEFQVNQRHTYWVSTPSEPVTNWGGHEVTDHLSRPYFYAPVADRWQFYAVGMHDVEWTLNREDITNDRKSYKATISTAQPSLDADALVVFGQTIEASMLRKLHKGTAQAKEMVLTFDFKSNVTGTYVVEVLDVPNDWSISIAFTVDVADTWESKELAIPKEMTQFITPDNDAGLHVGICLVAGTNFTGGGSLQTTWASKTENKRFYGQVNLAAAVSNYCEISDVQLELGPNATPFERLPFDTILERCQRYMEFNKVYQFITMANLNNALEYKGRPWSVRKRDRPGDVFYTDGSASDPFAAFSDTLTQESSANEAQVDYPAWSLSAASGTPWTEHLVYSCVLHDLHVDAELHGSL